ncbi:MAG: DUF47 domain-containing protein [Deltaproteobacteria bacterium]|nr:DUF47 domain-containing protein [Deltaproteobacteria bacterium]
MFGKFIPKETSFFTFFEQHIQVVEKACKELMRLTEPGADLQKVSDDIRALEHQADVITHRCMRALHKTFITPFERSDIHSLIVTLDEIIDKIEDGIMRISLYELKTIPPEVGALSQELIRASTLIHEALVLLPDLKNSKAIIAKCVAIHECENNADSILRSALARLFKEESDPKKIIQWKEILEYFEQATDECEDVGNIIEGVVIEAS